MLVHRKTCLIPIVLHMNVCGGSSNIILHSQVMYSKTCVKRPLSKRPKIGFRDQLSLNAGQKYCRMFPLFCRSTYCRMLQRGGGGGHSALLLTFIKLPFVIKIFVCLFLSCRFTQVLLYIN